ncbi:MAG TPA: 3-hydroxyacyl-CoA dehydrogenase NAD-binding domain-containing protein, partial [Gemmatales bacterium]|nr:3-hydroxyacyl-CoA dehydrogenase NAD-binding domain-containing protein [Gemmatales bacterium]
MREWLWLECTSCGERNYRTQKETKGTEKLDLKIRVFRDLDRVAPEGCILASNSSGFPLAALASATDRPAQV